MLRAKQVSVKEVVEAHLDEITKRDPEIGAFLTVDTKGALEQAERAQALIDDGKMGALTGIPIALKDNMSTKGIETTCASKILKGYVPPFDATVVARLKEGCAPILGKANLDEFAMGASTETSAYKITKNPIDTTRSPGGSSGGSAAAVAAGMSTVSLGSDTGGSIRQPASLCGIVGFKPTYGRVSRYGLVAFGSSLDQIGPMGRCVEDVARVSHVISGHDPLDSTSLPSSQIRLDGLKEGSLKGLKFALPKEYLGDSVDPEVRRTVDETIELLRREGATVTEVSVPAISYGVTTYYIIAPAEASSNLGRFDGIRFGPQAEAGPDGHIGMVARSRAMGFGKEVKTRIMVGTYALSAGYYDAYYLRATQIRTLMRMQMEEVMKDHDFIIGPTSPIPAFKIGELLDDPMALKLVDFCTIPANMGGFPAISIPAGFTESKLPVGIHLISPNLTDERLLQTSFSLESALGLKSAIPS